MNAAIYQAFERMKVNAIEKVLIDGRPLAMQAATVAVIIREYTKHELEFKKQYDAVIWPVDFVNEKIFGLEIELNTSWPLESEIIKRSQFLKNLARQNGYTIRTAYRRIDLMITGGLVEQKGEFLQRKKVN